MSDLALRQRVAEAVGWSKVFVNPKEPIMLGVPHDCDYDPAFPFAVVPAYETDIAAAWSLVDDMIDGFYGISPNGNEWDVTYEKNDLETLGLSHAPTAPLAICKAYLAWCEAKQGGE